MPPSACCHRQLPRNRQSIRDGDALRQPARIITGRLSVEECAMNNVIPTAVYRTGGLASIVAGLLMIAAQAPSLFQDIYGSAHVLTGLGSVLLWVLGSVLFGASVVRAKVFPREAGFLLAIGTLIVPVAYAAGLSVRIVGLGAALAAVG